MLWSSPPSPFSSGGGGVYGIMYSKQRMQTDRLIINKLNTMREKDAKGK